MRGGRIILATLVLLAAWAVVGCAGPENRWPWEQRQVPVTPPKEQVKLPPAPPAATPPAGAPASVASTGAPSAGAGQATGLPRAATSTSATAPGLAAAPTLPAGTTRPSTGLQPVATPPGPAQVAAAGTTTTRTAPAVASAPPPAVIPAPIASPPPATVPPPAASAATPSAPPAAAPEDPGFVKLTDLPDRPTPPRPTPAPDGNAARPVAVSAPRPPTVASVPPTTSDPPVAPEVVSTLGIQVNNKYITVEDILRSAAGELAELPKGLSKPAFDERAGRILSQATNRLVQIAIVLPEAESKMTEDDTKKIELEVDKTLRALVDEVGGSRKKLEEVWIDRGTTLDLVLKDYRNQLVVDHYLQSKIVPDINVSRKMLYDYYLKHRIDKYSKNKKVQMQVLAEPFAAFTATATPTKDEMARAKSAARAAIEDANRDVRENKDFTAVVKARSKALGGAAGDGVWPLMEVGNFREALVEAAVFKLAEGQISGIIETPSGFYLVKAVKVEAGNVVSFEDAQEEIEKTLEDEQYNKLRGKYLATKTASYSPSEQLEQVAMEKASQRYWKK